MVSSPSFQSSLDANAPPFYPSMHWYPAVTDEYYDEHPHSPGSRGFVLADACFQVHDVPDEELFDAALHPLSEQELLELEQVDEINAMLADLELLETHQELYQAAHQKTREVRSPSDVAGNDDVTALMKKLTTNATTKRSDFVKHNSAPRAPKNSFHAKKSVFAPIHQPRSVK